MNRLTIIGNGMLGRELAAAAAAGQDVTVYDLPDFDITDRRQLRQAVEAADCIVNCAAYTNVDQAERERELCAAVNAAAPGMLGELAAATGKYVIHISTDFVFGDLTDAPQRETDPPHPLSVYGATKLEGERRLLASGCNCGIIRVEWSYGAYGGNFISKILGLAKKLPELKVVADQTGSPTWTGDMARAILDFLGTRPAGVYHFAAAGYATRFEVAAAIIRHFGLKTRLISCSSSEFPAPAARPHNSKFDCTAIDKILSFRRPAWQDALERFLDRIS
ncbi:MAG: dTDP-4-dehydrorhamnose reductase [Victivallaceae bacterium]|nr:dTDP-4-dehydrorhamnose reductase [Victivallaceae bacterium]